MNYFLSMTMLLLTLAPQHQKLPGEFYRIPEQLRESATLIISGKFAEGRTPCIFMADGSRVWFLDSWFNIKSVYRGQVGKKSIRINTAMLPKSVYVNQRLERDHNYLVLLRPNSESMERIKTAEGIGFRHALHDEEIIAIVELK